VPAGGRPKPNLKVSKPRGTVLYDYSAGDTDEINLFQGEIIEIFQEGLFCRILYKYLLDKLAF
jgi:hypothetical protein